MNTGDKIKVSEKEKYSYMRLVSSFGFRPSYVNGYVIVGELYYKKEDKAAIGKSISKARRGLKMKRAEFANMLGVTSATVCNWERGYTAPDSTNRKRLKEMIDWEA